MKVSRLGCLIYYQPHEFHTNNSVLSNPDAIAKLDHRNKYPAKETNIWKCNLLILYLSLSDGAAETAAT